MANPQASDWSKSLSSNFMVQSIPQSAYRYTGGFRGKYTANSHNRALMPVFHLLQTRFQLRACEPDRSDC